MTTTILLTDSIRALPYFSSFREDAVDVPAKPFVQELLQNTLVLKDLSLAELFSCIETCIYFALDTSQLIPELLWKIGIDRETFSQWLVPETPEFKVKYHLIDWENTPQWTWIFSPVFPALVKAELIQKLGIRFTREQLIKLGIRCLDASPTEISALGNLRLLKWAYAKANFHKDFWENEPCCFVAARGGHLDVLKYAHEQGANWGGKACGTAARGGHLACLRYLHEHGGAWEPIYTSIEAIKGGHLDCLKYAYKHGSIWPDSGDSDLMDYAAKYGRLDCLQYLYEQEIPWNSHTCELAAAYGHLDCLEFLHEHTKAADWFEWYEGIYEAAVRGGNEDCVAYVCSAILAARS